MFHFDPNKVYSMPPYFGGSPYDSTACSTISNTLQLQFTYVTDERLLCSYIPEVFELLRPEITLSYCEFHGVSFLNGSQYNVVQLTVPAIFHGKKDCIQGNFILVIWEDNTIPIYGGREESGMPKIPADIENLRTYEGNHYGAVSFEGKTYLKVCANANSALTSSEIRALNQETQALNAFGWRYIPNVGKPGPALSQPILYPQSMTIKKGYHCTGDIQWFPISSGELLTQAHIINALRNLPIRQMKDIQLTSGSIRLCPAGGKILS